MPVEVILPRVDMDMAEGKLSSWHVQDGDTVAKGQTVFEIETDKAAMEIEAPASGVIRDLTAAGETIAVGTAVAWIYEAGEAYAPREVAEAAPPPAAPVAIETPVPLVPPPSSMPSSGTAATPLARKLARERKLDIAAIAGTGPRGRVQSEDVRAHKTAATRGGAAALHVAHAGGPGAPVVFIHGFGSEMAIWKTTLQALDPAIPTLRVDLPAHGRSSLGAVESFDGIAEAVAAAIKTAGHATCHIAGHSFGGLVGLALAAAGRLDIRSLMLISPAGLGPDIEREFIEGFTRATRVESLTTWLRLLFAKPALVTPAFAKSIMQSREDETMREHQRRMADTMFPDGTQAHDLRDALDHLKIPCKILWGRQDRIIPVTHTANLPGNVALHLLADTGHVPHLEQPALVARLIKELVASAA